MSTVAVILSEPQLLEGEPAIDRGIPCFDAARNCDQSKAHIKISCRVCTVVESVGT